MSDLDHPREGFSDVFGGSPKPIRYADEHEWQTVHPEIAEGILRRLYAEARPLFAYFHREVTMGGTEERKPYRWEKQGSPDRQGSER